MCAVSSLLFRHRNLFLRQRSNSRRVYCFALSVRNNGSLDATDCEFDSNSLSGARVQGTLNALRCRIVHNLHAGGSVSPYSVVRLTECEIGHNDLSGIEISGLEDAEEPSVERAADQTIVVATACHIHE